MTVKKRSRQINLTFFSWGRGGVDDLQWWILPTVRKIEIANTGPVYLWIFKGRLKVKTRPNEILGAVQESGVQFCSLKTHKNVCFK